MEDLKIIGEVEDIIFHNADNGYTVFTLTTEDDEVTCVGVVPQIHSGETLEIHGSWTMHPLYGRQVQIQYFEKSMPTTTAGMEKYPWRILNLLSEMEGGYYENRKTVV